MRPKELIELISEGESTTLEFKRKISSSEKIAKEVVAFANTIGGYLLIGVDDDGTLYGIESEKSDTDILEKACCFLISPPIEPIIEIVKILYLNKFLNLFSKFKEIYSSFQGRYIYFQSLSFLIRRAIVVRNIQGIRYQF